MFDNIRRTRRMRARFVVDLIKQYFDDDMIFQITDDADKVKTVKISSGTLAKIKEQTFDLVMKDVTEYATLQDAMQGELLTTLPQIAQYGPAWGKILVQTSGLQDKQPILDQLDAMSKTPPTPPKPSITIKWEELDNVEKAAFAQQMGLMELAQHEMQAGSGPQNADNIKADLSKTMIREGAKTGRDGSKAQMDAAATTAELALKSRELGTDESRAAAEAAASQREGDVRQQEADQAGQAAQASTQEAPSAE
jgi:hypothetical protein